MVENRKKMEMNPMTSDWRWTLNGQKYLAYSQDLPSRPKFLVSITLRPAVFEIQCCRKLEKSERHQITSDWPWTLTTKSTLYIHYVPSKPRFLSAFPLWPAIFKIQGYWKSKKMEMHQVSSDWPCALRDCRHQRLEKIPMSFTHSLIHSLTYL